jgi:hypothetical protein
LLKFKNLTIYEILDSIKKFIINKFKNINLKNLSRKKITKKISSEPGNQLELTNQTHDVEHEIRITV